jgi:hypothetical protein
MREERGPIVLTTVQCIYVSHTRMYTTGNKKERPGCIDRDDENVGPLYLLLLYVWYDKHASHTRQQKGETRMYRPD